MANKVIHSFIIKKSTELAWLYHFANIRIINLDVSMGKHPVKGIELPEKNLFAFKSNSIYFF